MKKKTLETYDFFSKARNVLGDEFLTKLWGRSKRHIYAWGASPAYCKYWRNNPMDKIITMLEELNNKKEDEMVEDVLLLLAKKTSIQLVPADYIFKEEFSAILNVYIEMTGMFSTMAHDNVKRERVLKGKMQTDVKKLKKLMAQLDEILTGL